MSAGIEQMVAEGRADRQFALVREHWAAVRRLWLAPDPLRAARLGPDLAPDFWFGAGLPGLASIKYFSSEIFKFVEDGLTAVIIPAYDTIPGLVGPGAERHVEELRDLVAVDLNRPDRHWRRRGKAVILGNAFLEIAGQEGEPVPVYRNPLSWLRSGGAGVCILDWNYARDLLLDHELVAEDIEVGNRLEADLAPSILVMEAA